MMVPPNILFCPPHPTIYIITAIKNSKGIKKERSREAEERGEREEREERRDEEEIMARNEEKNYSVLNRLLLQKEKEKREERNPKRPPLVCISFTHARTRCEQRVR
ncbi:Reticulocyte-binding protein 2 a [Balamuthia mandrillaris]